MSGQSLVDKVNPMIGASTSVEYGEGKTFPGAATPFGLVQLSPDTEDHGFGYHHIHTRIKGFSMTHMSGPGCANEGDVLFSATTGPVLTQGIDFQSPYSHQRESAEPGYYQVELLQWGIHAELSATDHTGVARFTFPAGEPANILLPISHTLNNTSAASVPLALAGVPAEQVSTEVFFNFNAGADPETVRAIAERFRRT